MNVRFGRESEKEEVIQIFLGVFLEQQQESW